MINKIKARNLILYLISAVKPEDLGKTKLYKLIFFVDSHARRELGESITGDTYLKFPMGPVPQTASTVLWEMEQDKAVQIAEMLKGGYFMTKYTPLKRPDMSVFSKDEIKVIDDVLNRYGQLSRRELINMSHEKTSWIEAEDFSEMDLTKDSDPSPAEFLERYKKDIEILSKE